MKILVTGAAGYIGPALLDALSQTGADTTTCDAGWFASAAVREGAWCKPDHPDFTTISLADLSALDAVIHLAGYSNDPLGQLDPDETLRLNYRETIRLAQRARDAGVSVFVFASSCSVYGNSGDTVATEDQTLAPLTHYARSKALAEADLLALQTPGFRAAILRGATVFGASPVPRTDLLLNEFCAYAALGRSAELRSTGDSWRPFMPVDDFARALTIATLHAPATTDQRPIWNIAPPSMQMTVRDATHVTARIAGLPPPKTAGDAVHDNRSYRVDGTRFARNFPMFSYSENFDDLLAACISAFAENPMLETDLSNDRFVRIKTLQRLNFAAQ